MKYPLSLGLALGTVTATLALSMASLQAIEPGVPLPDAPASESTPPPSTMPILPMPRPPIDPYGQVIERTKAMVSDPVAQRLAAALDLHILNVTWEDTGRFYGSAVGPNISDMTLQMPHQDPRTGEYQLHLMPVIRHPNFTDVTADVPLDTFFVRVGNERGQDLRRVALSEVLGNLRRYLHDPNSWEGRLNSLLAQRDSHVLVSAQACFLPIPQEGTATFNPVLFNYQSYPGDPAVLTILATREGTSITVIDNQRDGFEAGHTWGQRLFFNKNGERASFTGQRFSDFEAQATASGEGNPDLAAGGEGLNLVLLIQVPLKQREPMRPWGGIGMMDNLSMAAPAPSMEAARGPSDVEAAVIGHGPVEGPFTEIDGLPIERDPDYPIRVTVQFYKATSNGVVSEADLAEIRQQIDRVYAEADYVGSLVVDGPSDRPTEHDGPHQEPADWWQRFWERQRRWLQGPGDSNP
jgi:hypothetical protein